MSITHNLFCTEADRQEARAAKEAHFLEGEFMQMTEEFRRWRTAWKRDGRQLDPRALHALVAGECREYQKKAAQWTESMAAGDVHVGDALRRLTSLLAYEARAEVQRVRFFLWEALLRRRLQLRVRRRAHARTRRCACRQGGPGADRARVPDGGVPRRVRGARDVARVNEMSLVARMQIQPSLAAHESRCPCRQCATWHRFEQ